jgi:hypothetical protein
MMSDTVRVSAATADSTPDGTLLLLKTVDGPDVKFLLDDLAMSLLGLTLHGVMQVRRAQIDNDKNRVNIFKEDNEK